MRSIGIVFAFLIGFFLFLPKDNIFFYLQRKGLSIDTHAKNTPLSLILKNGTIFYKNADIGSFDICKVYFFGVYDKIKCNQIKLMNYKINNLTIKYNIISPLKIVISSDKINGEVDLKKRYLKVYFDFKLDMLKRDKKGYFYELYF
jgi:hypothetical protein